MPGSSMIPGPLVPPRPVQTLDLGCWGALTHRRGGLSNGLPPAPGAMENLGAPALPPTCSAGAQFDPATRDYSFSPPAKRGERVGGENSPNEQFALGPPELGWPQRRAVRLAYPFSGCPFSGLPYPGRGRRDALPYVEVHGEAQQGYGEQGLFPGLAASSPRPSPLEEERGTESDAEGSRELGISPGIAGGRVPCASLVHPLCIWTFNVNAAVPTACCPAGFSGTISLVSWSSPSQPSFC